MVVARDEQRLDELAAEVDVPCEVMVADLAGKADAEIGGFIAGVVPVVHSHQRARRKLPAGFLKHLAAAS